MNRNYVFSTRLNQVLQEQGMKQSDLLKKCALFHDDKNTTLSQSSLSQYITGERLPRPARLLLIARALDVTPDYLLGYSDDRNAATGDSEALYSSVVPEDIYTRTIMWLKESGWKFKEDKDTGNYTVRKKGWNYDRAVTLTAKEMYLYLDIVIGSWEYLMKNNLSASTEKIFSAVVQEKE